MKFTLLKSFGGDYLVALQNIAYLRTDENGQTKVGMVGGDSLLVVGTMEEVAEKIEQSAPKATADASPATAT